MNFQPHDGSRHRRCGSVGRQHLRPARYHGTFRINFFLGGPSRSRSPFRRLSSAQAAADALNRHHDPAFAVAHPQRIIEAIERERSATGKANSWLADPIVAIAGTMAFFHLLWATIAVWAVWQSGLLHNKGFDHFPYAFLFFMLGGIMQSLFVPTMLTASNRAAERDRIKDEADHRSLTHLYEVNEEQLRLLRALAQGQDGISEAVH